MKILVTGSAGFIGSHICKKALDKGYEVYGLDLKKTNIKRVKSWVGNITNKNLIEKITAGMDYIIHTAAVTSVIEFQNKTYESYKTNVLGFNNVMNAAHKNKIKKFIYASSSAVYLNSFREDDVIDIHKLKNSYAKSKLMNEMVADSYSDMYGMNTIGMRFFNVYGEGENSKGYYASIISQFLKAHKEGKPLVIYGDGKQARDFIYVEDVADITIKLLERGEGGLYNVGTGSSVDYNNIADLIDKDKKQYVKNPLSTYQYITKADTTKLIKTTGRYNFKRVDEFIKERL